MKKGNDILIPPAYFLNNYKDGFFVEVPEKDFSAAQQYGSRSFVLKFDETHVISIFKNVDKRKLKYVYFYPYQSTVDGRWFLYRTWSDKVLSDYPCKEITTQEELETRIAELKEKVNKLNEEQETEIKMPIEDFVKKHISEIDTTRKLALFITKLMKILFSEKHFVTEKQLLYFSTPKNEKRYKTFHIRKKSGGLREINAPAHHLDKILFVLNVIFKSLYTPHSAVMGFTEGKSIADNAARHTGQHYVFNIDLKDFFTSIPQARVWGRLKCWPFNLKDEVRNVVAGLCCAKNSEIGKCVLPQGAPTSPLLTNAVCDLLDRELYKLSKKYGLHYSRYADDITFSSMHNVYQEDSNFRKELKNIIEEQNFCINDKKTRLLRTGQRQEVTGLTVNSKVNVTRKYVRDIRYILHLWESKGYAFAYSKFYKFYKTEKGYIKKGEPVMENVIGGKLNYLRMIKGAGNECYQKLLRQYEKLQQIIYVDNNTDKGNNYVYVQQYTLTDFKKEFETEITLQISDDEKLVGKCKLFGMDKTISISHKTQEKLCPIISHLKVGDTFTSELLKDCFVTLCRQKGKNFWLITHKELERSRCLSIQNAQIDPEKILKEWEKKGFEFVVKQFQTEILKKSDVPDYVSERDIREFIYFVTHSKNFDRKQKLQRDNLLARDMAIRNAKKIRLKRNNEVFVPLDARNTATFLSLFNEPRGLKYLTHDFDNVDDGSPHTLDELYAQLQQISFDDIPKSLKGLLWSFMSSEEMEWSDTFEVKHRSSIKNVDWKQWSEQNNNSHPINNPDFATEIQTFRSTIRVDRGLLTTIIDRASENMQLNITKNGTDFADFYTNTYILYLALKRIFAGMNERIQNSADVEVSLEDAFDEDGSFLMRVIICHKDSYPAKSLQETVARLNNYKEAGDFGTIRGYLNGYCLWSVESIWDTESMRWNILKSNDMPETETIANSNVKGFKHILTFYIV